MKNCVLIALAILFIISCGSAEYPTVTYTNNYIYPIEFKTAEKNSPVYTLAEWGAAGDSITLSSNVPGRMDIKTISEKLVTWEYNSSNIYNIKFIKRKPYPLEVLNFAEIPVTISEKNGLLDNQFVEIDAAIPPDPFELKPAISVYTTKPVFMLINAPNLSFKLRRSDDSFILGINPPSGEWWK